MDSLAGIYTPVSAFARSCGRGLSVTAAYGTQQRRRPELACCFFLKCIRVTREPAGPPLWSSGQSFWLQIQWSRVRFLTLRDFLRSKGSTQPRGEN
jgi:hypothetical protein